jgi:hypothetical protein
MSPVVSVILTVSAIKDSNRGSKPEGDPMLDALGKLALHSLTLSWAVTTVGAFEV